MYRFFFLLSKYYWSFFSNEDTYQFRNSISSQELESFQDQPSWSSGYEGMARFIFIHQKYEKFLKGKGKMTTYWLDGELDSIFNNESLNESLNAQSVEDDDAVKCP